MTWSFTVPGQPPSGNHANKIGLGYGRGGRYFPKIVKTDEAAAYQAGVALIVRTAKPSAWAWPGTYFEVRYRLFLTTPIDADNVIKVLNDGIFPALGVDDQWALPHVTSIQTGLPPSEARVEVTIID
jgi:hypothetical protein